MRIVMLAAITLISGCAGELLSQSQSDQDLGVASTPDDALNGSTTEAADLSDRSQDGASNSLSAEQQAILDRAKLGVGYSYYWGHGAWRSDGAQHGSCSGSCPSCSHTGSYGADCSGFVAKCWQIPSASPLETDLHPYATADFFNKTTHWSVIPRSSLKAADSLVYNTNGAGHMMLFEKATDPWGSLWVYQAVGCDKGVTHDLRTAGSAYIAIRREGL